MSIYSLSGISVKDFGAVGDGVKDDTEAVQKAVSYLASRIKLDRFRLEDNWNKGSMWKNSFSPPAPAGLPGLFLLTVRWRGAVKKGQK